MIDNTRHIDWSVLNDFADGILDAPGAQVVAAHLEQCATCRNEYAILESTLGTIAAGATVASVPDGLWSQISDSIDRVPASHRATATKREYRFSMPALAAAASLLIVASVSATLYIDRQAAQAGNDSTVAAGATPMLQLTATDAQFVPGVEALERQLQSQRDLLQPQTIVIIERSLATIDAALAEARAALIADPANAALRDVLETTYRQKMDFLTRATKIAVGS